MKIRQNCIYFKKGVRAEGVQNPTCSSQSMEKLIVDFVRKIYSHCEQKQLSCAILTVRAGIRPFMLYRHHKPRH